MVRDPNLIHYACIARGTVVLAEFNSKDAALGAIAAKCLAKTPPFHATFSHTVRSRTYTFLIDEPFAYFGIFDEKLENSEGLLFLKSVRAAFAGVYKGSGKSLKRLRSHCFQGEFNPVFRQLVGSGLDHMDTLESPDGHRFGQSGSGSGLMLGRPKLNAEKSLKKMKNKLLGELNIGRKSADEGEGKEIGLTRDYSLVMHKNTGLYSGEQKAKKIWKKQVWIILSLDLLICLILFAIWLWVCSGFKCMES